MKEFTEAMRYDYDLGPNSVLMDVGGFEGGWAEAMLKRYNCEVFVYEPVAEFCAGIVERLRPYANAHVFNYGLAGEHGGHVISVRGDSSGLFSDSEKKQFATFHAIGHVMKDMPAVVDVLKLNCEGGEFDILEAIIAEGLASRFRNIQVQFHTVVPDYEARCNAIRAKILETHFQTFVAPWCWENWQLK